MKPSLLRPLLQLAAILWLALATVACQREEVVAPTNSEPAATGSTAAPRAARTAAVAGEIGVDAGVEARGILVYAEGTSHVAVTDGQGRYVLSGLPEGEYRLHAMRHDLESRDLGTVLVAAVDLDKPQPFLRLGREIMGTAPAAAMALAAATGAPGAIAGNVVTAVPGDQAAVRVMLDRGGHSTLTAEDGSFEIAGVAPGVYTASFTRSGYEPRSMRVSVDPGATATLANVQMNPASGTATAESRIIFGTVDMLLASGELPNDFSGVRVFLQGTSFAATPDQAGRFQLVDLPEGVYTVGASAAGFLLERTVQADLRTVAAAEVSLLLVESDPSVMLATLRGAVALADGRGAGVTGATVALAGTSFMTTTANGGRFELAGIEPGTYDVVVSYSGYRTTTIPEVALAAGQERDLGLITLERDIPPPTVVMTNPTEGARNVAINNPTAVIIQFSTPMNATSVIDALSIEPRVAFKARPESRGGRGGDTFLIELSAIPGSGTPVLRYDTRYTITIARTARSLEDVAMSEDFRLSFRTGRPMVISSVPADRARDVFVDHSSPLRFFFNAPLQEGTIKAEDIVFSPRLFAKPTIYFLRDDRTGWTILQVDAVAEPDREYTVTLRSGARTISGERVSELPYRIRFRTAEMKEFNPLNQTRESARDAREQERNRR